MLKKWFAFGKETLDESSEQINDKNVTVEQDANKDLFEEDFCGGSSSGNFDKMNFTDDGSAAKKQVEESLVLNSESPDSEDSLQNTQILPKDEGSVPEDQDFFARLKLGLSKTRQSISGKIDTLLKGYTKIDESVYEELEEILISSDVGYETAILLTQNLRKRLKEKKIEDISEVKGELISLIEEKLMDNDSQLNLTTPTIIIVVGVNGVGKTTTIGKLAYQIKKEGKRVLLAAADTFRAAAAEQLEEWGRRANVSVICHKEGSDPSAVIFDGIQSAKAQSAEVLICDTAGRLHNKKNLMLELEKVFRIVDREYSNANKEVLLVIDSTTGQNAIAQAKTFKEVAPLTGLILTKLDGTARGGVVIGIHEELKLPIRYIGVGEGLEDLQKFNAKSFAEAIFQK